MNVLAIIKKETATKVKIALNKFELNKHKINITITSDVIQGLESFLTEKPHILILDDQLKGLFIAKTIGDIQIKKQTVIYMLSEDSIEETTNNLYSYIDFYIAKPLNIKLLLISLISYANKYISNNPISDDIKRAEDKQLQSLPILIDNKDLRITHIYSPYNKLSGDKLLLTEIDENNTYYGIVIDCAGHDLLAWQQTGTVETMFKYSLKFLKQGIFTTIQEVLEDVNNNLVPEEMYVAATVFKIDLNKKTLQYVSAGIPSFFIKYNNKDNYEEYLMQGKVLGYKIDAKYQEHTLDISKIEKIVFTTDGLTEILTSKKTIKNDDISAFFITFNN